MLRKTSKLKALAVAVATPNLMTNALASERGVDAKQPQVASGTAVSAGPVDVAQNKRTMTKEETRRQVQLELSKMSAKDKAKLGRSQVEIDKIVIETSELSTCCLTPTNGVGCTDPATGGIACCLITLKAPG